VAAYGALLSVPAQAQGPRSTRLETRRTSAIDGAAVNATIERGAPSAAIEPGALRLELPRLTWEQRWSRFRLSEGVFTGILGAVGIAGYIVPPATGPARWQGGIAADDAVRNALMLQSHDDRQTASSVSDGLLFGMAAAPLLIDAVLTAWLIRDSSDVALQMMLMDLQAHAFAQGVTALVKWAVRRERPLDRGCREDATRRADDPNCGGQADPGIADHSFFSGHASVAFTSAALICLHHTEIGLFGPAGDAAACATGIAIASTVGALRIMADRHYLSDVAIGAGVGILSGWILPYLLHFASFGDARTGINATIAPSIDTTHAGLNVVGSF
jgi:membrane-associated phospholipid phosphatase